MPTANQFAQLDQLRRDEATASAALTSAIERERAAVLAARVAHAHARDERHAFEAAIWRGARALNSDLDGRAQ